MRKAMVLAACLLCAPARAEVVAVEENGPELRLTLKLDGKDHRVTGKLLRTKTPNAASLLIDAAPRDDLSSTAAARNMAVFSVDLDSLPASARAAALRDLSPMLRKKTGAGRVFGHASGETGAALAGAGAGALFDGLLLEDPPSGAATTARSIDVWGSDAYWRATPRPAPAAPEPANRRSFFIAGATACGAARAPALRALLAALDDWAKGVKPPPSRAPGAADLVPAAALVWPKIPGLPPAPGGARLVPKIDADGNEAGGLRLPNHALPLATFTGFGAPKAENGPACGAILPFPATKAEREKTGDPRVSLVERYGSRAYFVATMCVVADRLVKERLLLKEDADAYVAAAKQAPF